MKVREFSPFMAARNGFGTLDTILVAHNLFEGTVLDFDNLDMFFYIESFFLCSLNFGEENTYIVWRLKNVNKSSYL